MEIVSENKKTRRYIQYLKEVKGEYLILSFAYFCVVLMQLQIPQLLSKMLVSVTDAEGDLLRMAVLMALFVALEAFGNFCFGHYNYKLCNQLVVASERDILYRLLRIRYEKMQGQNSMYLAQQMNNDLCVIMDFYIEKIPLIVFQVIKTVLIFILLFRIHFYVGLLSVLGGGFYALLYFATRKKYYRLNENHTRAKAMFSSVVCGKLSKILVIKLNSWYETSRNEFGIVGEKFVKIAVKYLDYDNLISNLSNLIGRVMLPLLLLGMYFGQSTNGGVEQLAEATVAFFYMRELASTVPYIVQAGKFYQAYKVSYDRMEQLFALPMEQYGGEKLQQAETIQFREVSFSYGEKTILESFSFCFEKGKIYAVCGENGVGKSTMFLLMMGILMPDNGTVCWNGKKISEIDMEDLKKNKVAFVSQEPVLMEDTIYNNLFYGSGEEKKSVDELKKYPLLDFVNLQPEGYETKINNQNSNLSGGQKQRIAIMRALLKGAGVLLFDEPTSALDVEGVRMFVETLQDIKKDKVIILISHDTLVQNLCDEKIVLQVG